MSAVVGNIVVRSFVYLALRMIELVLACLASSDGKEVETLILRHEMTSFGAASLVLAWHPATERGCGGRAHPHGRRR